MFSTDQCEGLPEPVSSVTPLPPPGLIEPQVKALIPGTGADFRTGGARAYYESFRDFVQVPPPQAYFEPINWYRTACYEFGHWTGSAYGLARDFSGGLRSARPVQKRRPRPDSKANP